MPCFTPPFCRGRSGESERDAACVAAAANHSPALESGRARDRLTDRFAEDRQSGKEELDRSARRRPRTAPSSSATKSGWPKTHSPKQDQERRRLADSLRGRSAASLTCRVRPGGSVVQRLRSRLSAAARSTAQDRRLALEAWLKALRIGEPGDEQRHRDAAAVPAASPPFALGVPTVRVLELVRAIRNVGRS